MPPDSIFVPRDRVRVTRGEHLGTCGVIVGPGLFPFDGVATWKVMLPSPIYLRHFREDQIAHAEVTT